MINNDRDKNIDQEAAKKFLEDKESSQDSTPQTFTPLHEVHQNAPLPKIKTYLSDDEVQEMKELANKAGWKPLPINILPSAGLFYPEGTEMMIKAAEVGEIRHWSTLDENDAFGLDDHFNFVASKCLKVKMPGKIASYKDLKEEDRFFLIFAIRDLTFKEGENKMFVNQSCKCSHTDKVELRNDNFSYYDIDDKIMKFYNENERCFILDNAAILGNGIVRIYVPSIGISEAIKKHLRSKAQKGTQIEASFLKIIPFIISDWRLLTGNDEEIDKKLKALEQETFSWNKKKLSAVISIIEGIRFGTKLSIEKKCSSCGEDCSTPIQFQGGLKSIFVISNILDELI